MNPEPDEESLDDFDALFDDDLGLDQDLDAIDPFEGANRLFNRVRSWGGGSGATPQPNATPAE